MNNRYAITGCAIALGGLLSGGALAQEGAAMTFFVTNVGLGDGANLGGLEGADAHCQSLAGAADAGDRTWRAYLSTIAMDGQPGVNARDRIGDGPWHNAAGVQVAAGLDELHSEATNINKETALSEAGDRPQEIHLRPLG